MRKDISINDICEKGGIKMNKSELARQYNCCWKTIDRRLNPEKYKHSKEKRIYASKLDLYKEIIDTKLEKQNLNAMSVYYFLKKRHNYEGKYGIVNLYVRRYKKDIINKLTIRFETEKGYQSQVDWKESLTLHDTHGVEYIINIFLIVLGFSRYKYIELTYDKSKPTVFKCLRNAFEYFGGTTEEILFDNMKTIVNHAKSTFEKPILNEEAIQFAKDAGFIINTCRAYRPQTKGKVETLAKVMNRLKAFDYDFVNLEELEAVVKELNYDINYKEKSQGTDFIPIELFKKEKEHLSPVNLKLLSHHYEKIKTYKVSNESMINYKGQKYSVPNRYVKKELTVSEDDAYIYIYYNSKIINSYKKNNYKLNYKEKDYIETLKNTVFDYKTDEEIQHFIEKNLRDLDLLNIEREK